MNAGLHQAAPRPIPRWQRAFAVARGRTRYVPLLELATLVAAIAIGIGSYFLLARQPANSPLSPPFMALLLVANLVPAIALLVLLGRRVAMRRAARSPVGGGGRLHVRLVALFSTIAAVPTLLVVIFASLLFQYGVEFWFSDRARGMLENASELAQGYYREKRRDVADETVTMAGDLRDFLREATLASPEFAEGYGWQVLARKLSESAIVTISPDGTARTLAMVNPDSRPVEERVSPDIVRELGRGVPVVVTNSMDRIEAVTRLLPDSPTYLYASRATDLNALSQSRRAAAVLTDYRALLERSRTLQLRFNAALLLISLLIVGAAVWIALTVADRLVRPVGELVDAARKVAAGDLAARVEAPRSRDEIGTLAFAFNRMTERLQEQTQALVAANDQLDRRRAFTEAVLSGVTAGVVSIDAERRILLINSSAAAFLAMAGDPVGARLDDVAPDLARLLDGADLEPVVQLVRDGETRTLAVKIVADARGHVITFDDITQQLLDQRRAAWSDVARRIAHEIKNPLTPIQLAAERLQRRYGKEIAADRATFDRLTDTIVRQVGDLRRMVDEFSSFARMPKPMFAAESIVDIARQAMFLHEVAHPGIRFVLNAPDPAPVLVCDRRQLGQALTNIVKNAVEAIGRRSGEGAASGMVEMTIADEGPRRLVVTVADDGAGLPSERARLFEPYVTLRARGTGLGLAIVKKIVEEHLGTIDLHDRDGGGAVVRILLDPGALAPLAGKADGLEAVT
ncbi:HAMP domain-containing protein [Sphingomonas changnyeongensis]|uniref:histidine kinase n=1 Tax=Sphingomonas changnyeongensis TaxID=2698679 RepID=A0A7Z2NWP9_9SPHN|nr:ATP-binding protein [Sphingomonas changnyeongensis]QHL91190.1 HAMP domain-containing protein [Sphingomonas changnyeongensis]